MDEQLWRLAWALPLVLAVGVGLIYWLKRMGLGLPPAEAEGHIPRLLSSTPLTEHTRVLVVEAEGRRHVVFESSLQIHVHAPEPDANPVPPMWWRRKTQ
ncbi:MAG: hypothetical protein QM742_10095 [Aquabacterium sp.]